MLKYLLLGCALCFATQVYAGGDSKTMDDHELRVKAGWNCESAQRWCAEDQNVPYNRCMCAKRMCDAADRASEAGRRGYDSGAECAHGGSLCSTAQSEECRKLLDGPRPAEGGSSALSERSLEELAKACEKGEANVVCVKKSNGECHCLDPNGNAKGISCSEVKARARVLGQRCEAAKKSPEGDVKGICDDYNFRMLELARCEQQGEEGGEGEGGTGNAKGLSCDEVKRRMAVHKRSCEGGNKQSCKDYEDRAKEAERCDKEREKERNTGNAKGDDCSTVIKKAQVHKANCAKGSQQACKDYEWRRKEAEKCGAKI